MLVTHTPALHVSVALLQQSSGRPAVPPHAVEPIAHTHAPPAHDAPVTHAIPQPPQCAELVSVLASQPFIALPSQFAKPVLHAPSVHVLAAQLAAALGREHAAPHAPQCASVFVVLVSQPLTALPSQLPKPMLHAPSVQLPVVHDAAALGREHTIPHAPQWLVLLLVLVSQPLLSVPSQSPKPALHVPIEHTLAAHAGAALLRVHATPQPPQLEVLLVMLISQPLPALLSQF